MYKRIYKDADNEGFIRSYNAIGVNLLSLTKFDDSLRYHLLGLEMINRMFKEDSKYKGVAMNNIGLVLFNMKKYNEALDYFLKSFKINTQVFEIDHFLIVATLKMIGIAYFTLNNYRKSLEYYLLEVDMNNRLSKTSDKDTSWSYYFIGMAYYNLKDYKSAYQYFVFCIEIEAELYKKKEKTFTNQELFNELVELTINCCKNLNMYDKCDELNRQKFRTKQEEYNESIADALRKRLSTVKHSVTCSIL
jgi:tetratricopeptide (TPR) repeat protein